MSDFEENWAFNEYFHPKETTFTLITEVYKNKKMIFLLENQTLADTLYCTCDYYSTFVLLISDIESRANRVLLLSIYQSGRHSHILGSPLTADGFPTVSTHTVFCISS